MNAKAWLVRHPNWIRRLMNLWPPFLFVGIRVREISPDFRYARVELKSRPWTRNINNTQYGGSLFSMTDPIFALLLFGSLGWERYLIWDRAADIQFIAPGRGTLTAEFHVEDSQVHEIRLATQNGDKTFPEFQAQIRDAQGELVCTVHRTLYVRLKAPYRPAAERGSDSANDTTLERGNRQVN